MTCQLGQLGSTRRVGFSLLEVIIATGILAASTVLLLSLFSTGERHADRAESRGLAQLLCQSKMNSLLADPSELQAVEAEPVHGFPNWRCSVEIRPTPIQGLVQVRVAVHQWQDSRRLPDAAYASNSTTFELVRWTRERLDDDALPDLSPFSPAARGTWK